MISRARPARPCANDSKIMRTGTALNGLQTRVSSDSYAYGIANTDDVGRRLKYERRGKYVPGLAVPEVTLGNYIFWQQPFVSLVALARL